MTRLSNLLSPLALATTAVLLPIFASQQAQAATITTLYNTGVNDSGTVLATGIDSHYTVVSTPTGDAPYNAFIGSTFTPGSALASSGNISSGSTGSGVPGDYNYQTTFSLTGFDLSSAVINGRWVSDDSGTQILLNGNSIGVPVNPIGNIYSFTINSGFVSGVNTLNFIVNNAGTVVNPTGLQVSLNGTAAPTDVPEPFTVIGTLVGGTAAVRMRKKLQAANK